MVITIILWCDVILLGGVYVFLISFFTLDFFKKKTSIFMTSCFFIHSKSCCMPAPFLWEAFCSKPGCTVWSIYKRLVRTVPSHRPYWAQVYFTILWKIRKGKDLWTTRAFQLYCRKTRQSQRSVQHVLDGAVWLLLYNAIMYVCMDECFIHRWERGQREDDECFERNVFFRETGPMTWSSLEFFIRTT